MLFVATFQDWLLKELKDRDWTHADMARKAGVSRTTITNLLKGARQPGVDAAAGIAKAFGYTVDYVLARANMTPQRPEEDELIEQINNDLGRLSGARRRLALDFIRFLASQQSSEESGEAKSQPWGHHSIHAPTTSL